MNGIPFLVSVTVTALLCAVLFRLREHLVAAVFSLSAAAGICLFAFSGMLLNGFLSLWNQLAEVLGKKAGIYLTIYQLKGFWKSKWGAGSSYFPWHCLWAVWLLNPEASVVCAAPSFCGSPSGGSGKNRTASRYQALSWLLRWNPVRIKLHDEK